MTDGKDKPWFDAGMLSQRRRSWSVLTDCSLPALQPHETRGQTDAHTAVDRSTWITKWSVIIDRPTTWLDATKTSI